jgi:hypothetical protein
LRQEARKRQEEAESVRSGAQEQLRKADEVDPDVVTSERGGESGQMPTRGDLRAERAAAEPATGSHVPGQQTPGQQVTSGEQASGQQVSADQRSREDVTRTDTAPGPDATPREEKPRNL